MYTAPKLHPKVMAIRSRGTRPGNRGFLYYPNEQDASTLWYHDHAMGITRLNIFAGLFGAFIIRDAAEQALNLPGGAFDIPLADL